jgi:hypothetical protein
VLPAGSAVDVTTLDVSWSPHPDDEVFPDSAGDFTTTVDISKPTVVTALVSDTSSADPYYAVFMEALVLEEDTFVTLNSKSTAVALVWNALGVESLVLESSYADARRLLEGLTEIENLGTLLETKLVANTFVLQEGDTDIESQAEAAILEAATAIAENVADGTLMTLTSRKLLARGMFGAPAEVTPEEADDIKVYERDDTGNVNIENDTQLYLSVKITTSDGAVLQPHISGLRNMVGPQSSKLFVASKVKYDFPNGKNCTVQVVTPGNAKDFDPMEGAPRDVYRWLIVRTLVERVVWPVITSTMSLKKVKVTELTGIIIGNVGKIPELSLVIEDFARGNHKSAMLGFLKILWNDFATVGPITEKLAKKLGKGFAEEMLAKLAAKIGAKFVPGIGQIAAAYEIANYISVGVNAAKTVTDIFATDSVIDFDVKFPLAVDEVVPSIVKPDNKNKTFTIKGSGFSKIVRKDWWNTTTLTPQVTFFDTSGAESVIVEPDSINSNGTSMVVTLPGRWLHEDMEGPLKVEVHHPIDTDDAVVEKDPAVTIVANPEISSISPSEGGVGTTVTIYGAGFSNIISDNEVVFGSAAALISQATETSLKVVVPAGLSPGVYDVKVRCRFDGIWSDWTDSVSFEVIEGDVKITVTDNGGAKDDAFALYVDGRYIGTMYATNSDYSDVYSLSLSVASHSAMLLGIEAPDSIGTYGIGFQGVENVTGDPTSGSDLVPGVRKYYTFDVPMKTAFAAPKLTAYSYTPMVPDIETAE